MTTPVAVVPSYPAVPVSPGLLYNTTGKPLLAPFSDGGAVLGRRDLGASRQERPLDDVRPAQAPRFRVDGSIEQADAKALAAILGRMPPPDQLGGIVGGRQRKLPLRAINGIEIDEDAGVPAGQQCACRGCRHLPGYAQAGDLQAERRQLLFIEHDEAKAPHIGPGVLC
jgi:hypothetical protein